MTTITLPPELETAVAERARQNGTTPERLALDSLRREFLPPTATPAGENLADFLGDFVGCLDSGEFVPGGARMSEQDAEDFAEGMAQKRRQDKL